MRGTHLHIAQPAVGPVPLPKVAAPTAAEEPRPAPAQFQQFARLLGVVEQVLIRVGEDDLVGEEEVLYAGRPRGCQFLASCKT